MSFICIVCRDLLTNRPDGHGPGIVDIISTKCGHMYHLHCLTEWFRRKVDTANPNHECPYCNAVVTPNDVLRIFPSEDEETEELAAKFNEAKASGIEKEICQLKDKVEESRSKLEDEQLAHENLKFEHALKLSEIEQLKRDHEVDLSLLDSPQSNWKAMLDKERKAKAKMYKTVTTLEKRFAKQKAELEKENRRKSEESDKSITELKSQNESLRKKIERLQSQLQLQQQPFKPVFPTPAAAAPSVSHVPNIVSVIANTSSQSRRRSVPNQGGPMFCPHVSSSSQSQSAYAMPSFRSSGSGQSHFLNPPNPAQNPYQNLLSAAAAAASTTAVSSQSQSRNNPSHGNSTNQNSSSNQSHNPPVSSTSSSSTAQQNNPFSNQTSNSSNNGQSSSGSSSGGGGGGNNSNAGGGPSNSGGFNNPNFPASFPLAQAHNHNGAPHLHPHPSPMHLSMHYSTYYSSGGISSRNPPYPPAPYSFPAPSLSSAAGASHLSGGNPGDHVHHVQAAHVQPESATVARAATRLLPAHHGALQFYMQAAGVASGMAETVGVAAYPPFLAPTLHPPPLSPRH